jgi:type 1 fimbria pilin
MTRATCLWMTLLLLMLGAPGAHADNPPECRYLSGGNTSVTFVLPTAISIAADAPNGAMLITPVQASPNTSSTITCGWYAGSSGNWKEAAETMTYGVVNSRGGYLTDNVTYETGIPGIGYRITLSGAYLAPYSVGQSLPVSQKTFVNETYSLELSKTGPIASGSVLAAGQLASWQWNGPNGSSLMPETFQLGNSITFTTPSCTIATNPINVTLPAVTTGAFGGVGATSGKTPFQITLNCPTGTAVTHITMHTAAPDSQPGVVKPAGAGYAAGIGVQVLEGNSSPVVFENQTMVSPPDATTAIPYFAQYFQTAATVTGGPVKATVTFNIFYQ